MKKFLLFILSILVCFALSGCTCAKSSPKDDSSKDVVEPDKEVGSEYIWDFSQ